MPSEIAAKSMHDAGKIKYTPADNIFAGKDGHVHLKETQNTFLGAVLCERFKIVKYIEAGTFGKECHIVCSTIL